VSARAFKFDDRVFWLKAVLSLALVGGFVLSRRLWLSSPRSYPTSPVFDFLPPVAFPFDYVWLAALFALAAAIFVFAQPRPYFVAFVALAGLLALWDQSRWQPWFYQYFFMAAACALYSWKKEDAAGREALLNTCRLIVACVYFWSGLQKLNFSFVQETLPFLLRPYARLLPESFGAAGQSLGLLVPLVEVSIGVGLLTRKFRDAAVVSSLVAHALILALFVPVGRNTVIWPWNVAMPIFVVLLFRRDGSFSFRDVLVNGRRAFHVCVLLLFAILPALSFFNLWDSYLSSALYSGNTSLGVIRLSDRAVSRLPEKVRRAVRSDVDGHALSVDRWSYAELNVPAYPEPRIFRNAARMLCSGAEDSSGVVLEIRERPRLFDGARQSTSMDCNGLKSR
jgi:hypothetical protein